MRLTGGKETTAERSRVQQEAKLAVTNNDVGGHNGKEAARVKAHYAAYGREWTEEEKRKLTEHQESSQLTDCPVSGDKCEWGDPPCFKIYGKTFRLEQGQANDLPGEQLVSVADADLDMSPAADVRPATERLYVVYFIQAKGGDGECKVGITYSLQSRLHSLQTGNPHELDAVHTIQVDNKATAERIEEAALNAIKNAGADIKGRMVPKRNPTVGSAGG